MGRRRSAGPAKARRSPADEQFVAAVLAAEPDYEALQSLLDQGVDIDQPIDAKRTSRELHRDIAPLGFSALHVAAYEDDGGLCRWLLEHGATHGPSRLGWLPLEVAADWNSPAAVTAMLAHGVSADQPSRFAGPLAIAAGRGHLPVVTVLLEANARRGLDEALRNAAGHRGRVEVVRALLDAGADPHGGGSGWSLRASALYFHHPEILELLRTTPPRDLIDAAIDGDRAQCERMLARGDAIDRTTQYEITALIGACAQGHADCVELLLQRGADPSARSVLGPAIEVAVVGGHLPVVDMLRNTGVSLDGTLGRVLGRGLTPEAMRWLLAHEGPTDLGRLLCVAVQRRDAIGVGVLLDAGAPADTATSEGTTPLMIAAGHEDLRSVEQLLEAGADATAVDSRGLTALGYALACEPWDDPVEFDDDPELLSSELVVRLQAAGAALPDSLR